MVEFILIEGPIKDEHLVTEMPPHNVVGATAIFKGTVRADTIGGKKVVAIEFSTQKEIAYQIAIDLLKATREKFCLARTIIYHSVGKVNAGETCFIVEVNSAHRKEAFNALPDIANEFKAKVPVFGKELLEDNTHFWKQNNNE